MFFNVHFLFRYQKNNSGALPERIIVYRDGVSEGQVRYVKETEIANIKTGMFLFIPLANHD